MTISFLQSNTVCVCLCARCRTRGSYDCQGTTFTSLGKRPSYRQWLVKTFTFYAEEDSRILPIGCMSKTPNCYIINNIYTFSHQPRNYK